MTHTGTSETLSRRTVLAYALPAPALAMIGTTFYVFVPKFYSDVVGTRMALLSLIVLLSRVWDAVIDPAMGHLSDRTHTRWGRRRPWMIAFLGPLALTFFAVAVPPTSLSPTGATVWLSVATFLMFIAWTGVVIPYEALGPELTFDYEARNRLFAFREGAMVLGTVLAAVLPEVVGRITGTGSGAAERMRFLVLGVLYAALLVPAVGFCAALLKERRLSAAQEPRPFSLHAAATVWANRPFRVLLTAYTIGALGSQLPATLILFYVEHVLGSRHGGLFLLLYLFAGFAFVPLWPALARRYEKRSVWIVSMLLNTGAFAGVVFLGRGDLVLYGVLVFLSAVGLGGTVVLPASMEADVIDCDELENGTRREGVFSGVWSISKKLAAAVGAGLGLAVLDAAGYIPRGPQPASAVWALRLLYAGVPCLCNIAAICIASRYPITRESHAEIRRRIDERRSQTTGSADGGM